MKLVFVSNNGFGQNAQGNYYSGANVQHIETVSSVFDEIVFIANTNHVDGSYSRLSDGYKMILIDSVTSSIGNIKNLLTLKEILEEEISSADLVMCFGLNGYFAYKVAKKLGKPVIAYVGGDVYDTLTSMESKIKKISAPIMLKLIQEMVLNANFVHYVDEYLIDTYPTRGEVLVCPSVKMLVSSEALDERMNSLNSKGKQTKLGVIGYTHNKIKGIDTIIKSMSLLDKSYTLQVVGRGDYSWLQELSRKLKVEDRVEFLGVLEGREAIFNWLDSIDVYLQPSLTEGMPRATLEAMSRGCPVISTSVGGLKTIVNDKYRIQPHDYSELAIKIQTLAEDNKELMNEAMRNYSTARQYDYNLLNKKRNEFYTNIYNKVNLE